MKYKFLGDADGLTKDGEYELVGCSDTGVVLVDENQILHRVVYGKINDTEIWAPVKSTKDASADTKTDAKAK